MEKENQVSPVRNSSGALNSAGIILKSNPAAEQRGIISNGVNQKNKETKPPIRKKAVFFMAGIFLLLAATGGVFYAIYQIHWPIDGQGIKEEVFVVEKGRGVKQIGQQLEQEKLIRSAFWFKAYIWLKKRSNSLQAGEYVLSRDYNIPQITDILGGGRVIRNEAQLTFPEGFTVKQIKSRLLENGFGAAEGLEREKIGEYQVQYKFLSWLPSETNLEGFLFPDTYIFERRGKKEEIVKKFLDNFDKKLIPSLRAEIEKQQKGIYEIIILASIIQQEAVNNEEMPIISGVFSNRLAKGMALQSDATVNYATGKSLRQPTWDDTKEASPYNTYLHIGLPPGPICNPGLAAIEAAIYPAATDYYYFLHPLDGATVFSKTVEEHNRNKAKYLK